MENPIGQYKIGQVVDILKKEYPDISASSLRYWEQEKLLLPSGEKKEKGVHRVYTEEDLEIIRLIKELSKNDWRSIDEIREELDSWNKAGRNIEELRSRIKLFRKIRNAWDHIRKDVIDVERPESFYEYIYPEETFLKLLNSQNSNLLAKKAEKYNLIFPKLIGNSKMYNRMDLAIMKLFVGFEVSSLDKYNKIAEIMEYMSFTLKIPPSVYIPAITIIELTEQDKDMFITSALLYLEAIYFEEFISKTRG